MLRPNISVISDSFAVILCLPTHQKSIGAAFKGQQKPSLVVNRCYMVQTHLRWPHLPPPLPAPSAQWRRGTNCSSFCSNSATPISLDLPFPLFHFLLKFQCYFIREAAPSLTFSLSFFLFYISKHLSPHETLMPLSWWEREVNESRAVPVQRHVRCVQAHAPPDRVGGRAQVFVESGVQTNNHSLSLIWGSE